MDRAECLRTLGIKSDASEAEIRQAYLDLVRVWHPDRFASDNRLQQVAAERLCHINQAYEYLNSHPAETLHSEGRRPRPTGAPPSPPRQSAGRPQATQATQQDSRGGFPLQCLSFRSFFYRGLTGSLPRRIVFALAVAFLCLLPLWGAARLASLLRPAIFDADLIAGRALESRPRILLPSGIIDPFIDPRVAADTLAEWARGEALDLWKPASAKPSTPSASRVINEAAPAVAARKAAARPAEPHPLPVSGTELLTHGPLSGAGEVHVVNHTALELVATLVRGDGVTLRAVYVRPEGSASIVHISLGVYRVHLNAGRGLEPSRLQFRESGFSPEPIGPLEFFEVTSAAATSGQYYEVVLKPSL